MRNIEKLVGRLFVHAQAASGNAYSPYSGVSVGACVLDVDGQVHSGCNVENSSYGLTQCAERNALASAVTAGMAKGKADVILIYATGFDVLAPCGACRQVMCELMAHDAIVISCQSEREYRVWSLKELLPSSFVLS